MPGTLHTYSCIASLVNYYPYIHIIALVVIELLITCFQDLPNPNYEFSTSQKFVIIRNWEFVKHGEQLI